MHKTCIIIVGATAVGKTAFAIELAKKLHTQIISADSRQCYRELSIGVGKPSPAQLAEVKHYFIDSHSVRQDVNAAAFEQYALAAAAEIFQQNDFAVVAGGTGLYVNAFCEGLDEIPFVAPEIRKQVNDAYKEHGIAWLQQQIEINDPEYFKDGETSNPHRLMRTLEVKLSTGRSIRSYQTKQKKKRDFSVVTFGLELEKQVLHDNISRRVDAMMEMGLVEEVRGLLPFKQLKALNTVGYKEIFSFLDNEYTLQETVNLVKKNTRLYAKRQMTWFKKNPSVKWIQPGNHAAVEQYLATLRDCT